MEFGIDTARIILGHRSAAINRKGKPHLNLEKLPINIMVVANKVLDLRDSTGALAGRFTFLETTKSRKDWRTVTVEDVKFDAHDLEQQLVPTLNHNETTQLRAGAYGTKLVEGCRRVLSAVLPFSESEKKFLDMILEQGEIVPCLLTDDKLLQDRIQRHPILLWKALNVRKHTNIHPGDVKNI